MGEHDAAPSRGRVGGQLVLAGEDGRRLGPVDEVIRQTGFRPDLTFVGEFRVALAERLQAPAEWLRGSSPTSTPAALSTPMV